MKLIFLCHVAGIWSHAFVYPKGWTLNQSWIRKYSINIHIYSYFLNFSKVIPQYYKYLANTFVRLCLGCWRQKDEYQTQLVSEKYSVSWVSQTMKANNVNDGKNARTEYKTMHVI